MIFYIATDQDGKKHVLTVEAEAKKIDKSYVELDQPNDKAALKLLIQDSFDHIFDLEKQIRSLQHDQSIQPVPGPSADPAPAAPQPAPVRNLSSSYEATDIEDFILNRAEVFHVENIFSCLGTRMAELIKKVRKSADPAE